MTADRNRAIDGLRALAVGLVLIEHGFGSRAQPSTDGWPWPLHESPFFYGGMGVLLFFVLSGWLITGILLTARADAEQAAQPRRSVWVTFYLRRALRIVPVAYVAMAAAWLADLPHVRAEIAWCASYLINFRMAWTGESWPGIAHFWSLAVEEQFYLAWPAVILLAPRAWLTYIMVAAIVSSAALHGLVVAYWPIDSDSAGYILPFTRLDSLACGALLAWRPVHRLRPLVLVGVNLLLLGAFTPAPVAAAVSTVGETFLAGALVLAVSRGWGRRVLEWRPFVALGTISYGVYVWHFMVGGLILSAGRYLDVWTRWPVSQGWFFFAYQSLAGIGLATLSWFLLERPINRLKRHVPYVRRDAGRDARLVA